MGRKYVLDGAIVQCSMGMKPAKLMVITNNKVKIQGKFKATDTDLLVPETFFQCKLKPTPSGAFLPCIPMLQKWQNTAKKTNLRGIQKFLYDDSYTMCMPGSRITIVNPMQINAAGAAFEQYTNISTTIPGAMPLQGFDEGTLPKDDSSNGFLDGFQTALDIAGLVPGFGEIADGINAAIYVARGDYANAALSAAAMIPIGGQAATAAKLGLKGANATKKVDKVKDIAYHVKSKEYAQSVLDDINPQYFNRDNRFADGFYIAQKGETAIAEVVHHGGDMAESSVIRFSMDTNKLKMLDLTDSNVAKTWNYDEALKFEQKVEDGLIDADKYQKSIELADKAREEGYNAIKFNSRRSDGVNIVIYETKETSVNNVLKPEMIMPATD